MVNVSWWRTLFDADASNYFEREDWFLLASILFVWLDVFPCFLIALIPYSQVVIVFMAYSATNLFFSCFQTIKQSEKQGNIKCNPWRINNITVIVCTLGAKM